MKVAVRKWAKNHDSVSVDYGPLTFSLAIGRRYSRYGGKGGWNEEEVFPASPWNYGLMLDAKNPVASLELVRTAGPLAAQPFTPEICADKNSRDGSTNSGLAARCRRSGRPAPSQPCPDERAARSCHADSDGLRQVAHSGDSDGRRGPESHEWRLPTTASHCFVNDTLDALDNGSKPKNSGDQTIPRFTWWDHRGTTEWVQYNFSEPRTVAAAKVYWFDDTSHGNAACPPRGGCCTRRATRGSRSMPQPLMASRAMNTITVNSPR